MGIWLIFFLIIRLLLWIWEKNIAEIKYRSHLILLRVHTVNMIWDCWCWPWSPHWASICQASPLLSYSLTPSLTLQSLWKVVTMSCPHLRSRELCNPPEGGSIYTHYMNSLASETCLFFPIYLFTLSFVYTSVDSWVHIILWVIIQIQFKNFVSQIVSALENSFHSVPFQCSWHVSSLLCVFVWALHSFLAIKESPSSPCIFAALVLEKKNYVLSHVWLFATPWTVTRWVPLPMQCSGWEYWSGLPFPTPGGLPNPGMEPMSLAPPALADRFFTTSNIWEILVWESAIFLPMKPWSLLLENGIRSKTQGARFMFT